MKLFIKIFLLIIIAFLIYILIPLSSDRLIYIPDSKNKNFKEVLQIQKTPLNSFDISIIKYLNLKKGWIRVETLLNRYNFYKIAKLANREKTRKMVMFSGDTIDHFTTVIAKQAKLNSEKMLKAYYSLSPFKEGGILAQKYSIPFNTTERSTIAYMVAKSNSYFKRLARKEGIKFPSKEFKDNLIIASIIAKETHDYNEMPLISAVIHNRLKKGIRLQMDASLNYGKHAHTIVTPFIIKEDNSKYNTYKFKGLPPEPIGSVSKVALLSAFMPAKVDYIYFVKNPKGGHTFSSNYHQHLKKVKKYRGNLIKLRDRKLYKIMKRVKIKFPLLRYNIKIPKIKVTVKNKKVKKLKIY